MTLIFSRANAKLKRLSNYFNVTKSSIYSFDLISGWSCPFAKACLSKVKKNEHNNNYHLVDGPHSEFRCYSAAQEVFFKAARNNRIKNFKQLRPLSKDEMVNVIQASLPKNAAIIRIHSAGDFFNENYFVAWLEVAKNNPNILFYSYTKSLSYWIRNKREVNRTKNFILTASYGGRLDNLIKKHRLRYVKVVFSTAESKILNLPVDHDDTYAADPNKRRQSFLLYLHGIQPSNTKAAAALKKLGGVSNKISSYSKKNVK